jgi:hypothetical protein
MSLRLEYLDHKGPDALSEIENLRTEIDALVAFHFQLSVSDLELIFEDFPLIDRAQQALDGESRSTITRDLALSRLGELTATSCDSYTSRVAEARSLASIGYIPAQYD